VFLKVCSWTIICLFSNSICVVFIKFMVQFMASTIALLLLLIVSIIGEKILLHFHLTLYLQVQLGFLRAF